MKFQGSLPASPAFGKGRDARENISLAAAPVARLFAFEADNLLIFFSFLAVFLRGKPSIGTSPEPRRIHPSRQAETEKKNHLSKPLISKKILLKR
jgi:hypothetical protein